MSKIDDWSYNRGCGKREDTKRFIIVLGYVKNLTEKNIKKIV